MIHGLSLEKFLIECDQRHYEACLYAGKSTDYMQTDHGIVARYLRRELAALDCELMKAADAAVESMRTAAAVTDSDVMAQDLDDAADALALALDGERANGVA